MAKAGRQTHPLPIPFVPAGVDLFRVAKLMSHGSICMVEQRYGHLRPDDLRSAVLVLEKKNPKAEKPEKLKLMA